MAEKSTQSESSVAARDQLDEQQDPGPDREAQEKEAKAQEKTQRQELQSKPSGDARKLAKALDKMVPAGARAGVHRTAATQGGFMDQLSRRDSRDALEGHPCRIDLGHKGVKEEYDRLFGESVTNSQGDRLFPDGHDGDYGIYLQPALRDPETGIPVTAQVRLRDDTHALVTVPYEALRYSPNVGRR